MSEVVTIGDATLYHGDCRDWLPDIPEAESMITDPPYLEGNFSWLLSDIENGYKRAVLTPGKLECFNWITRKTPTWMYAWKCSGTRTLGGAATFHIGFEPVLSYGYPVNPPGTDIFDFPVTVDIGAQGHPWPKPLPLICHLVVHWSSPKRTVVDPFMGSGTTGVACMQLGRKFIGIEIERKYFDIACERIENAQRQGKMFA